MENSKRRNKSIFIYKVRENFFHFKPGNLLQVIEVILTNKKYKHERDYYTYKSRLSWIGFYRQHNYCFFCLFYDLFHVMKAVGKMKSKLLNNSR